MEKYYKNIKKCFKTKIIKKKKFKKMVKIKTLLNFLMYESDYVLGKHFPMPPTKKM